MGKSSGKRGGICFKKRSGLQYTAVFKHNNPIPELLNTKVVIEFTHKIIWILK
jgi:hypothetical protein